jgi:tetrachlorobenzoquinone reductase
MSGLSDNLSLKIAFIRDEAEGILSFDLRPPSEENLPSFTAGAHIDVSLSNGIVRSYSLINPQGERHRYVIAVNRDMASRGGSSFIHETLRVGDTLSVRAPRNNFPLEEGAEKSLLIAGGIGITPLWCMIQRLTELGRSWELFYSARTPKHAAFSAVLSEVAPRSGNVHFNFDQVPGGKMLDIAAIVSAADPRIHLYCCGPVQMLKSFEASCGGRPRETVHLEYFSASEPAAAAGGFTVILKRSGKSLFIERGQSILEAVLDLDVDVDFSCQEGMCGTCATTVLEGVPDHRDAVLTEAERSSNSKMMICCSGAKTDTLVLDI